MEQTRYVVMLRCIYLLPTDIGVRETIYGTVDPKECIEVDFEDDAAAFMLDYCNNPEIVSVELA